MLLLALSHQTLTAEHPFFCGVGSMGSEQEVGGVSTFTDSLDVTYAVLL